MPYRYPEESSHADAAFEAWGESLEEVFRSSWDAALGVLIDDPDTLEPRIRRPIEIAERRLDMLLLEFLQTQIYIKDAEGLLLRIGDLKVEGGAEMGNTGSEGDPAAPCRLRATAAGERVDRSRHAIGTDVKAVTLHGFTLKRTSDGWRASVLLDV